MRFKRVYIEITNTCNLSCSFCIQNTRKPQYMKIEQFQQVIEQVTPFTNHVYLHVLGEPLSHPQLKEFLHICEKAALEVILTTNGTLLKEHVEDLCVPCIRQLNVSVHSFPQHEQAHYLQDICQAGNHLAAHGIHVNYRLWSLEAQGLREDNDPLLEALLKQYGKKRQDVSMQRMTRFDLQDHVHLHLEEVFTWPSLKHPLVGTVGRCLGMKTMCAILVDGSVVPCCLDSKGDITLGNIFVTPLADIVKSERCKRMMEGFDQRQIIEDLCQHCRYRMRFK